MRKLALTILPTVLLSACAAPRTQTIDAQSLAAVRNQSIVVTVREVPTFTSQTTTNVPFGLIGTAMAISEGKEIIADNQVADPADAIAAGLAGALQERYGAQTQSRPVRISDDDASAIAAAAKGKARYVVDVRTTFWMLGYFPTDWTHYRVVYSASARLLDADSGRVLAEGVCKFLPESNQGAPRYDDLLANSAQQLKTTLAGYAASCIASLKHDMLALEGAPAPAPALASASVPTPAPTPAQAPVAAADAGAVSWKGYMACSARMDKGPNSAAYEARFAMEVQGDRVTVHRKTEDVSETMVGYPKDGMLELHGGGYRIADPHRGWRLAINGAFPEGASSYEGKGIMSAGGRDLRNCELKMTRI